MKLAHIIAYEPDRGMQFVNVAPRVMMNLSDLDATGLLGPGSRIGYSLLLAGPEAAVRGYESWLKQNMRRWKTLSTVESNRPEVQRALKRAHQFLWMVAFMTEMEATVDLSV